MLKITEVDYDSLGEDLGFEAGDKIIAFDGNLAEDGIDYYYYDSEEHFTITVETKDGDTVEVEVDKEPDEGLGLTFEDNMSPRVCKNKCKFCFVDQLPRGMRETMYLKDDDWRYSFLFGSYVTMTNVTEHDISRILRMHVSPLYISVHAYDDEVRRDLVKNPHTVDLINIMRRLSDNGIDMHTQVVMVEGQNDGEVLRQTIQGLYAIERVKSLAIVPVGLTGHRAGLTALTPVSKECARATVDMVEQCNLSRGDNRFCYCSDEMYLIAGKPLPSSDYYGNFDQIENGVGLISSMRDEIAEVVDNYELAGEYTIVTGVSATPFILSVVEDLMKRNKLLKVEVRTIFNDFFGRSVTVAGLITGRDIINQLKGTDYSKILILPSVMVRDGQDRFLDDTTIEDVERELGVEIRLNAGGEDLLRQMVKK